MGIVFSWVVFWGFGFMSVRAESLLGVKNQIEAFRGDESQNAQACEKAGALVEEAVRKQKALRSKIAGELEALMAVINYEASILAEAKTNPGTLLQEDYKYGYLNKQAFLNAVAALVANGKSNLRIYEQQFSDQNAVIESPKGEDLFPIDVMVNTLEHEKSSNKAGNEMSTSYYSQVNSRDGSGACNRRIAAVQGLEKELAVQLETLRTSYDRLGAKDIFQVAQGNQDFLRQQVARLDLSTIGDATTYVSGVKRASGAYVSAIQPSTPGGISDKSFSTYVNFSASDEKSTLEQSSGRENTPERRVVVLHQESTLFVRTSLVIHRYLDDRFRDYDLRVPAAPGFTTSAETLESFGVSQSSQN